MRFKFYKAMLKILFAALCTFLMVPGVQAKEKYKEEDLVEINEVYDTPRISHCHIELPVSWAYVDVNGKVTIVSSTRSLILYAAVHHRPWVFLSVKSASSNHILAVDLEIKQDVLY